MSDYENLVTNVKKSLRKRIRTQAQLILKSPINTKFYKVDIKFTPRFASERRDLEKCQKSWC